MKRYKYSFVYREHDGGWMGFVPKQNPMFEASMGLGVAHDSLEHVFPNDNGDIKFELMAVGAAYYIRELSDNGRSFEDNFTDLLGLSLAYQKQYLGDYKFFVDRNLRSQKLKDESEEPLFKILRYRTALHSNYKYDIEGMDSDDLAEYNGILKVIEEHGIHYLRKGYRFAQKRYRNRSEVCHVFWRIHDIIETKIPKLDLVPDISEIEVSYTLPKVGKSARIKVTPYPEQHMYGEEYEPEEFIFNI